MDTLDPFTAQAELGSCLSFSELLEQGLETPIPTFAGPTSPGVRECLRIKACPVSSGLVAPLTESTTF